MVAYALLSVLCRGPQATRGALVPTIPLPERPSLEQLRTQAKELQRAVRAGDPAALAEVAALDPAGAVWPNFRLSGAHLVLARRYGFASWPRLRRHVELRTRLSRDPGALRRADSDDPAETFLRLACLSYEPDDGAQEWRRAGELLAEHPRLSHGNVWVAAASADSAELTRILAADRSAAQSEGGPYDWVPLLYLAYSRHYQGTDLDAALTSARLLLDAGADPDAGFLWHGLPSPFTVLTGLFGGGEQGQPAHPRSLALARLLLDAGADPNDEQALYNRQFEPTNDHLELLLAHGLGTETDGPWRARLGHTMQTPTQLVRGQLAWAIGHGMLDRVRLLAPHVDLQAPVQGRSSATELAATSGHADLIEVLVELGASEPQLDTAGRYVAAALAADAAGLTELRSEQPDIDAAVRTAWPSLVVWAAVAGSPGAVALLVEAGFDINALGRTDTVAPGAWETALHHAASTGDVALARALLELGADPDVRDHRFDATPLGWAQHFDQSELVELLT